MVKKIIKYSKFILCIALILSLVAPSYAALSASDGSAFVTKAEFDSALADFNARLTTFEAGINSKIDSQVTSYLDRNGIWNGKKQINGFVRFDDGSWSDFINKFDSAAGGGEQEHFLKWDEFCSNIDKAGLACITYRLWKWADWNHYGNTAERQQSWIDYGSKGLTVPNMYKNQGMGLVYDFTPASGGYNADEAGTAYARASGFMYFNIDKQTAGSVDWLRQFRSTVPGGYVAPHTEGVTSVSTQFKKWGFKFSAPDCLGVAYFFVAVGDKLRGSLSAGFENFFYSTTGFYPNSRYSGKVALAAEYACSVY